MNEPEPVPEALQDLIDDYLGGLLDETRTGELEERLRADAAARRHFVRYSRLHTDLHLEVRARQATEQALDRIFPRDKEAGRQGDTGNGRPVSAPRRFLSLKRLVAACLLLALGASGGLVLGRVSQDALASEVRVVPRTFRLTFDRPVADSIRDANGLGTGLTHRLPGTGRRLPKDDPNLEVDPGQAWLKLTTTRSDIRNQFRLGQGVYLGVRLSNLGFTGKEDFAVTATIPDIPALEDFGQFGLYAGTKSDRNIRGGLIKWGGKDPGHNTQFLVNNEAGRDTDLHRVGLLSPGTDLRLTLRRTRGQYALTIDNLTDGGASTLTIRHHEFLGDEPDLFVGLFGANPYSDVRKTLVVKDFQVTVWTVSPSAPRSATVE